MSDSRASSRCSSTATPLQLPRSSRALCRTIGLATLVGTKTFGKGVVQSVFPLPDGAALKVTTARYVTPSGRSLKRVGLTPDIIVAEPAGAQRGNPRPIRNSRGLSASCRLPASLFALSRAALRCCFAVALCEICSEPRRPLGEFRQAGGQQRVVREG